MFSCADQDNDGKISFSEFQVMINPPRPREPTRPDIAELHSKAGASGKNNNELNGKETKKPERRRRTAVENPPVPSTVTRTIESKQQHTDKDTRRPEGSPLPLSLENIKLHDKMTSNLSLRK